LKSTGARIFLEMLKLHHVEYVFGLPGETTLALYREWVNFPDVRHILTHDERNAAYMAEAYAKVTGKVGISEAPSPGGAHPAPGVLESFKGSIPTICFTSDVPFNNDKRNMLSGFDQNGLYSPITKESFTITRARDIPHLVRRAFRVALADRPGAVHVRIPLDVYEEEVEVEDLYADVSGGIWPADRPIADLDQIDRAIELLVEAEMPVIVCGQGALVSEAGEAVLSLAEILGIPVGTTMTGKGCIPENHPLSIRLIGARGGTSFANRFLEDADLVFFVGSNTDSAGTDAWKLPQASKGVKIIHLDISRAEAGNNYPTDVALIGDARETLDLMAEKVKKKSVKGNAKNAFKITEAMASLDSSIAPFATCDDKPIHPVRFIKKLEEMLPEKSYVIVEPGVGSIYSAAYLVQKKAGRMFMSNYSMGALGYAIPAAVAAAVAKPDHTVVVLGGDGSFHFTCGELETYSRLGLNIKIVLYNNDVFGWIKGEIEHVYHGRPFATNFGHVDYVKIAEGFGLKALLLDDPERIEETLSSAFSHQGPVLIEMRVKAQDELVPPVPRWIPNARNKGIPYLY